MSDSQAAAEVGKPAQTAMSASDGEPGPQADVPAAGAGETAVAGGGPGRGRGLLGLVTAVMGSKLVRWGFVAVTVGLGAYAVAREWTHVRSDLASLGFLPVAGALFIALCLNDDDSGMRNARWAALTDCTVLRMRMPRVPTARSPSAIQP